MDEKGQLWQREEILSKFDFFAGTRNSLSWHWIFFIANYRYLGSMSVAKLVNFNDLWPSINSENI